MKILSLRILLVFIVSLAFCSEDKKYTLKHGFDLPEEGTEFIRKDKHEQEWSIKIPGIGYIQYESTYTSLHQYLGKEGEFYKFKATLTDVEINNSVNGIKITDLFHKAMENNPCYIYVKIDGDGFIDHIKPVDPKHYYLQEAYEAAYMSLKPGRYKYPFGSAAENVSVGDTWTSGFDSLRYYVNMGSPPSLMSNTLTFNLKTVKDKRGVKTAYIDIIDELTTDLNITVDFLGERRFITGHCTGKSDAEYRWDVENTNILYHRSSSKLKGNFKMGGKSFYSVFYFRNFTKFIKYGAEK